MANEEVIKDSVERYLRRTSSRRLDIKCALFDMDGVLFDSMPMHAASWVGVMAQWNIPFTTEDAYLNEGRTGSATIELAARRAGMPPPSEEEITAIYADKCARFNSFGDSLPIPGACNLVKELKAMGLRLTVVTGSAQRTLLSKIDTAYPGMFELGNMVTAFDVKHGKPSPEPYLMALGKMGVKHNEAFIVENAPLGAEAGRAANIFTIVVNTGPLSPDLFLESGADLLFNDMDDFKSSLGVLFNMFKSCQ